ncbi:MAG: barstar family protein [Clostridia bacterium]|nr:barstar family protein [Clostridia bacterium]
MQTICLFGHDYQNASQVHEALKSLLDLPSWYGMNADALADCLSELVRCPGLWVRVEGPEDVQACLRLISRVFADQGAEVKEL